MTKLCSILQSTYKKIHHLSISFLKTTTLQTVWGKTSNFHCSTTAICKHLMFHYVRLEPGVFLALIEGLRLNETLEDVFLLGNNNPESRVWTQLLAVMKDKSNLRNVPFPEGLAPEISEEHERLTKSREKITSAARPETINEQQDAKKSHTTGRTDSHITNPGVEVSSKRAQPSFGCILAVSGAILLFLILLWFQCKEKTKSRRFSKKRRIR